MLELLYMGEDLREFALDSAWSKQPFRWDDERRFVLRCELDIVLFHLYLPATENGDWRPARQSDGCPCDEPPEQFEDFNRHFPSLRAAVSCLLNTFPGVRHEDEANHSEYRTKRTILDIHDAMQASSATDEPYRARPDRPPADRSRCHPPRERN